MVKETQNKTVNGLAARGGGWFCKGKVTAWMPGEKWTQ